MTSPNSDLHPLTSLPPPLTTLLLFPVVLVSILLTLGITLTITYKFYTLACIQMQELEERIYDVEDDVDDLEEKVGGLRKRMERKGEESGEKLKVNIAVRHLCIRHGLREEEEEEGEEEMNRDRRDTAAMRSKRIFRAVNPYAYLGSQTQREPYTAHPDDVGEEYVSRRRKVPRPCFEDLLDVYHVPPLLLTRLHLHPDIPSSQAPPTTNSNLNLNHHQQHQVEAYEAYEEDDYPRLRIHPLTGLPDSRGATPGPLLESEARRRVYVYSRPRDSHYVSPEGEGGGIAGYETKAKDMDEAKNMDVDVDVDVDMDMDNTHPHYREKEAPDYFPQTQTQTQTQTKPIYTQPPHNEPLTPFLQDMATTHPPSTSPFTTTNPTFSTTTNPTFSTTTDPTSHTHPSSTSTHDASLFRHEMLKRESSTEAIQSHGEIFRDTGGSRGYRRGYGEDGFL